MAISETSRKLQGYRLRVNLYAHFIEKQTKTSKTVLVAVILSVFFHATRYLTHKASNDNLYSPE